MSRGRPSSRYGSHVLGAMPGNIAASYEQLRADYDVSRQNRYVRARRGVHGVGYTADWHFRNESQHLYAMELARDFDRNDMVVGQAIDRLCDLVLMGGFLYDPQTGDDELDRVLREKFAATHADPELCDAAGEMDFPAQERQALRQAIVDGDDGWLPQDSGTLEAIEAHRIRTPTSMVRHGVVLGIRLDAMRRRQEVFITRDDVGIHSAVRTLADVVRVPVRDDQGQRQFIHVYNPRRVSQTRGITALAPIAKTIGIHDDVQFAMLVKVQLNAFFAIVREWTDAGGVGVAGATPPQEGERESSTRDDGSIETLENIAPGMDLTLPRGQKFTGYSPNIPAPEFGPYTALILSFIAINLNLPLQVLMLDPKSTNFSGWRGALDQARVGWKQIRRWLIARFHRPYALWRIRDFLATDPALMALAERVADQRGPAAVFAHRWNAPHWPYIEPLKDAQANHHRLATGQISPRKWAGELGMDWGDLIKETVEDRAQAIGYAAKRARELNDGLQLTPPLTWRDLMPLPSAADVNLSLNLTPGSGGQDAGSAGQGSGTSGGEGDDGDA